MSRDSGGQLLWHKQGKALALDIVRGLCFLHTNKVIHRCVLLATLISICR